MLITGDKDQFGDSGGSINGNVAGGWWRLVNPMEIETGVRIMM